MTSTMLIAAVKGQHTSVLPLLHHCLAVFDEICGTAINFGVFFVCVTLIKIANTPLNRSAALVLSILGNLNERTSAALASSSSCLFSGSCQTQPYKTVNKLAKST